MNKLIIANDNIRSLRGEGVSVIGMHVYLATTQTAFTTLPPAVTPTMPAQANNINIPTSGISDPNLDHQFKFALKNMLPVPSNSEQRIILDEYNQQLSQFSIAINRIIREVNNIHSLFNLIII